MLSNEVPEPEDAGRIGVRPALLVGLIAVAIFLGGFGAWASLASLDSAAVAPGAVVVEGSRKTVQHLEGGIVDEILVGEGDEVAAGQELIRLDRTRAKASREQLRTAHRAAAALAARLIAERDGADTVIFPDWLMAEGNARRVATMLTSQLNVFAAREKAHAGQVSILEQQIAQSEEEIVGLQGVISMEKVQLKLLAEEIEAKESLLKKGLIDKPQVLALKHRRAEVIGDVSRNSAAIARVRKSIGETKIRISELETLRVNEAVDELQDVEGEVFELEEQLGAAEDILRRTVIRAPIGGTIVGLNVHTPGGVIGPGEELMDIVPSEERLLINARIDPVDVDVARPGLPAHIRLTAYNQRHLAPLEGRLLSVSADHLVEERTGDPYYLGRVELLADQDQFFEETELYPGMQTEVMILTGSNTLLDYIAEPITRTLRRAFRED